MIGQDRKRHYNFFVRIADGVGVVQHEIDTVMKCDQFSIMMGAMLVRANVCYEKTQNSMYDKDLL